MKLHVSLFASALVLAMVHSPAVFATDDHARDAHHGHSDLEEAQLELNQGEKWQTDAPLRQGMQGIQDALQAQYQGIHEDQLGQNEYEALAQEVESQVTFMFENCALPADADAQLHTLLAHVLAGTDQMRDGAHAREGAVKVVDALRQYDRHFHHSGWTPLAH